MMNKENLNRRSFLKLTVAAGGLLQTKALTCLPDNYGKNSFLSSGYSADQQFKPVKVSADRVIKTVVGLRPYRRSDL